MTVPDREKELERLLATVETPDESVKILAGNLQKLVGDVHSIKGEHAHDKGWRVSRIV